MHNKKVAFHTLGCKLNFSETSTISRLFIQAGFVKVDLEEVPDVFVINTCSVTEQADKKCAKIVKEALRIAPDAYIIVIGCYAQLKPTTIAAIPGVDVVMGASEKFKLLDLITHFTKKRGGEMAEIQVSPINEACSFVPSYSIGDRTRTFLKVQDGCNYHCAFCTIPLARGKSRSTTVESIVKQAKEIGKRGIKEIVLTGINIGDYGIIDNRRKVNFLTLIQELDTLSEIARLRISSIEPNLLSDDIITFVANSRRFTPHFHIPLQSGSDKILQLMHRRYDTSFYKERIAMIKSYMPHCCIGADVIVGFPGEAEDDFLATYQLLSELDIAYLHVFPYSERSNTKAILLPGVVPIAERTRRSKMLRILSEKKLRHFYTTQLGSTDTILFEQKNEEDNYIEGFTANYIRVTTPYNAYLPNTLQKGKLTSLNTQGLVNVTNLTPSSLMSNGKPVLKVR